MPKRDAHASEAKEGLSDEAPPDPDTVGNITRQAEAIPKRAKEMQDHRPK